MHYTLTVYSNKIIKVMCQPGQIRNLWKYDENSGEFKRIQEKDLETQLSSASGQKILFEMTKSTFRNDTQSFLKKLKKLSETTQTTYLLTEMTQNTFWNDTKNALKWTAVHFI